MIILHHLYYIEIMFGYKIINANGRISYSFMRKEMEIWVKENYIKFNSLYFDNILPPINSDLIIFEITNSKKIKSLGTSYNKKPYKIRINFRYDLPEIEFQDTLLHEMIHIWQYIMGYKGGHGKSFKKKAKDINKYGWDISTYYKNKLIELKDAEP